MSSTQKFSSCFPQAIPFTNVNLYSELCFSGWVDHILVGSSWSYLGKCFNLIWVPILLWNRFINGNFPIKDKPGASLVAQWLRICLPMQGTRVRALVWEDPTCHGAAGPVSHNYWACASGACAPHQERPRRWEACAPRWRVVPTCHN